MYTATIRECSKELTAKERVMLKDVSTCESINELAESAVIAETDFIFKPETWAIVDVHNDDSKDSKDYVCYVFIADDGRRYTTSSDSFYNAFINIANEMCKEDAKDEEWAIKVILTPSRNYKGKNVLTCTII